MIGAGDLAQDAAEREWERMTDSERIAALHAADADADAAYYAAMMAEAERAQATHIAAEDARISGMVQVGPYTYADPTCRQCRGMGVVYDTVDYGSTTAQWESPCDCQIDYLWAIEDGDGITFVQGDVLNTDGVVLSAGEVMYEARRNERGYMLAAYGPGELVTVHRYDSATWLLEHCATIAPLTEWAVLWDDMGADDAPRY